MRTSNQATRRMQGTEVRFIELMTSDAQARKHFTDSGWRQAIKELVTRGWSDEDIIELLKSNHMQFAVNAAPLKCSYTSVDIISYLDTPKRFVPALYEGANREGTRYPTGRLPFDMMFDFTS